MKHDPNSSSNDFSTTKGVISGSSDMENLLLLELSKCFHLAKMFFPGPCVVFPGAGNVN